MEEGEKISTASLDKIKEEIVVFLRNGDILTIAQRGVTTISNNFTAIAAQTVFTLSNNVVRNIRAVTIDGTSKSAYSDYNPAYNSISSTITFSSACSVGQVVSVGFDYSSGTAEKIWPDYPQILYYPVDCPRIGFDIISHRTTPIGIGTTNWLSDALVSIKAYDMGNYKAIDQYLSTIRQKIKDNAKGFYHFQFAYASNIGPILLHDTALNKKVFERSLDLTMRFGWET